MYTPACHHHTRHCAGAKCDKLCSEPADQSWGGAGAFASKGLNDVSAAAWGDGRESTAYEGTDTLARSAHKPCNACDAVIIVLVLVGTGFLRSRDLTYCVCMNSTLFVGPRTLHIVLL